MYPSELPKLDNLPEELTVSNSELSMFRHNPRCYFYKYVLGLNPPDVGPLDYAARRFGSAVHLALEHYYMGDAFDVCIEKALEEYGDALELLMWHDDYRTSGRLESLMRAYVENEEIQARNDNWEVLYFEELWSKPIGANITFEGVLDLLIRDKRDNGIWVVDHKTTSKKVDGSYYPRNFENSYQITGYSWLGEYATRFLKEGGQIPEDSYFEGVIINAIQTTKTIEANFATLPYTRTEYQVQEFVRNAYLTSQQIIKANEDMEERYNRGEPIENAWPHWPTFSENFCDWREINAASSEAARESLLNACTTREDHDV